MRKFTRIAGLAGMSAVAALAGCRTTKPGTHVEIVEQGGSPTYVSGAAGMGTNQTLACGQAVHRAVSAIALRFAQENDDVADEVAEEVGAADGAVFMQRYAANTAMNSSVRDVRFDPVEHVCLATVKWTPPIFVKQALLEFAQRIKNGELAEAGHLAPAPETAPPAPAAPPAHAPAAPAAPPPPGPAAPPPPSPTSVAPAPAAPTTPASLCTSARARLAGVLKSSQGALDNFEECKRRTGGDETICHRYKLYVEEAQKKEHAAGEKLAGCLNAGLSVTLRRAVTEALPGHAAVSVENRDDGTVILWTFSPVDQTAFALEVDPGGETGARSALAANQAQWVREQLGL